MGRFLKGPDDHGGDGGGADTGAADAGADQGADKGSQDDAGGKEGNDDGGSIAGDAVADEGDKGATDDAGKEGEDEGAKGKASEGESDKSKDDAAAEEDKVPEGDYELTTIKIGEGDDATEYAVDSALLNDLTPELKEAGLGTKSVQKLATAVVPKLYERFSQEQQDAFATARADWAKQAKADPEIGGKNWDATVHNVARALDTFVGPMFELDDKGQQKKGADGQPIKNEFRRFLDETGIGNHPTMLKAFAKIGAQTGEDGNLARATSGGKVTKSKEEVLYPEDAPKQKTT